MDEEKFVLATVVISLASTALITLTSLIPNYITSIIFTVASSLAALSAWLSAKRMVRGSAATRKKFVGLLAASLLALALQPKFLLPVYKALFFYPLESLIVAIVAIPAPVSYLLFAMRRRSKLEVKQLKKARAITTVKRIGFLNSLAEEYAKRLFQGYLVLGFNPYAEAAKAIFYALISIPLVLLISLLSVALSAPAPVAFLGLLIPIAIIASPYLRQRESYGERTKSLADELPMAVLYASLAERAASFYYTLQSMSGKGVFKAMEKEAEVVKKYVNFGGMNDTEAMEYLAESHPSKEFTLFLKGYTGIRRGGGDSSIYLDSYADRLVEDTEAKWQRTTEAAANAGEAATSIFLLLPALLLTGSVVFPQEAVQSLTLLGILALPMITIVFYIMLAQAQPGSYDRIEGDIAPALVAGALITGALVVANPVWLVLALSLTAICLIYGAQTWRSLREISALEKRVPLFLEGMAEYSKMGHDVIQAIIRSANENRYGSSFDKILRNVSNQLILGVAPTKLEIETNCWFVKYAFFLIGEGSEIGVASPVALHRAAQAIAKVVESKKRAKAGAMMYTLMSYITPIGLALMTALITGIIPQGIVVPTTQKLPISFQPVSQAALTNIYLLIIIVSACLGLLTSRATTFTGKNVMHIAVILVIAVGTILALQAISIQSLLGI